MESIWKILFFVVIFSLLSNSQGFVCPTAESISPCTCRTVDSGRVLCSGSSVTQDTVDTLFTTLRSVNNLTSQDLLSIYEFRMEKTNLSKFDLSPLIRVQVTYNLIITNNPLLTEITGPSLPAHSELIDTVLLYFTYNGNLTSLGFGDTLKYFNATTLSYLNLANNALDNLNTNNTSSTELLPGLALLKNLGSIHLSGNRFKSLQNGPFRANYRIHTLNLGQNGLVEVGADTFAFDLGEEDAGDYLTIYMDKNWDLSENGWSVDSGLDKTGKEVQLFFSNTAFSTLPQEIFETFLDAHPKNSMYFEVFIQCDERVSWLKARTADFQPGRVKYAFCKNDMGETVFTSNLVP